jgi:DnaJ family protein A protein 5
MSPACYDGFGDGAGGFFVVYSELFENIDSLERAAATESGSKFSEAPCFGDSKSPVSQVKQFYAHWSNFVSSRSFAWRDKWNLAEGPNRYVRREMEKENKKEREQARKEYIADVRDVTDFVKRRDPRWAAWRLKQKQDELDKAEQVEKAKRDQEAARAQQRQRLQEERRLAELEMEAARLEAYGDDDHDGSESDDAPTEVFECVVCDKVFKSQKQLENHEGSKKHKEAAAILRRHMQAEELAWAAAEVAVGEEEDGYGPPPPSPLSQFIVLVHLYLSLEVTVWSHEPAR